MRPERNDPNASNVARREPGASTLMSDRFARYAWAVGLTVVAMVIAVALQERLEIPAGLIFAGSVALSARYFGTGPGLVASALSIVAIDLTLLPPLGRVEFTHPETFGYLVVFLLLSLVISGATHSLRRARMRADDLAARTSRLLEVTKTLAEAELPRDVARVVMEDGLKVMGASAGLLGIVTN